MNLLGSFIDSEAKKTESTHIHIDKKNYYNHIITSGDKNKSLFLNNPPMYGNVIVKNISIPYTLSVESTTHRVRLQNQKLPTRDFGTDVVNFLCIENDIFVWVNSYD